MTLEELREWGLKGQPPRVHADPLSVRVHRPRGFPYMSLADLASFHGFSPSRTLELVEMGWISQPIRHDGRDLAHRRWLSLEVRTLQAWRRSQRESARRARRGSRFLFSLKHLAALRAAGRTGTVIPFKREPMSFADFVRTLAITPNRRGDFIARVQAGKVPDARTWSELRDACSDSIETARWVWDQYVKAKPLRDIVA
jgi:hypothetical protein